MKAATTHYYQDPTNAGFRGWIVSEEFDWVVFIGLDDTLTYYRVDQKLTEKFREEGRFDADDVVLHIGQVIGYKELIDLMLLGCCSLQDEADQLLNSMGIGTRPGDDR